jgi:regulator of ribonuclease activity A
MYKTTDICDEHGDKVHIAEPLFRDYGGRKTFHGPIATIRTYEDNSKVREALEEPGNGRVLVVDGKGSMRCALLGDQLAELAQSNGWAGVIVNGCIRDAEDVAKFEIGVKALATCPLKSEKRGLGEREVPVVFAGLLFQPGWMVYADLDGVIVSENPLR